MTQTAYSPPDDKMLSLSRQRLKVLFAGFCSQLLCIGIARFAYTPLLPIMQAETGLSDTAGGWLAATNYMGYMSGAIIAASLSNLAIKDRLYRWGLLVGLVTTLTMAMTENVYLWAFLRFFSGLSTAATMLLASGLILNWLMRHHFRGELGPHFAGIGVGIMLSAGAVALMSDFALSWDQQWIWFTLIGVILFIPAWFWLPRPDMTSQQADAAHMSDQPPTKLFLNLMLLAYFCAGYGFVISATFIVAVVERKPALAGQGPLVFMILGLAATIAVFLWDQIARRIGTLQALIFAYGIQAIAIILPALSDSLTAALLSASLFGATFIGCVSLVLSMAGRFYPSKPAKLMGKMTLSYGIAQICAPALTGALADWLGNYDLGLYLAGGWVFIGTGIILVLVRHSQKSP